MSGREVTELTRKRVWVEGLCVFLVCLAVYIPTVATTHVNTDAAANSLAAWRLAQTGYPWMEGLDLSEPGDVPHYGPGRDGHMVTTRTPGQIWLATPFYIGSSTSQLEWSFTRGGLAAAASTGLAVALMFGGLRRALGNLRDAALVSAVFAFATPVWSVSANALWTHPVTVLGVCGAVMGLSRDRLWISGLWLGVAMTGRVHVAIIAAVLGLGMSLARRSLRPAVTLAVPTCGALVLVAAWNAYVFGSVDPRGPYVGHAVENLLPGVAVGREGFLVNVAGFLVSPDRGLLVWTPVLLLLAPAAAKAWRGSDDWVRWLVIGGVAYAVAQLGLNVFHGGDVIYGYRLALELLVCLVPLYARAVGYVAKGARALIPPIVGLQGGAIFLGAVFTTLSLPERQVWTNNAAVQAIVDYPSSLGVVFAAVALAWGIGLTVVSTHPRRSPSESPDRSRT